MVIIGNDSTRQEIYSARDYSAATSPALVTIELELEAEVRHCPPSHQGYLTV